MIRIWLEKKYASLDHRGPKYPNHYLNVYNNEGLFEYITENGQGGMHWSVLSRANNSEKFVEP